MKSPEFGSQKEKGFAEIIHLLGDGERLVLSRNKATYLTGGRTIGVVDVHYEDLNDLSDQPQLPYFGTYVTGEFLDAAEHMTAEQDDSPWVTYPLLTVVNREDATKRIIQKMHIPQLIEKGAVSLYSVRAPSHRGGEMISLGIGELVRDLAARVGVISKDIMVMQTSGGYTMRELEHELSRPTHLPRVQDEGPGPLDSRSESVLAMMQMDLCQAFMTSDHRLIEGADGRVEVVIHVGTRPDLQTLMLEMIDLVELYDMQLVYTNTYLETDEIIPTFGIERLGSDMYYLLSRENGLDMAVYNAHQRVISGIEYLSLGGDA